MVQPLVHNNPDVSDEQLAKEASDYLSKSAALQAMVQILEKQREMLLAAAEENSERQLGWLKLDEYRKVFSASDRMKALEHRPDIRQRITTELTGLREKAARNKDAAFQADLIDSAIDDGDITLAEFESAFKPEELAVYMDASLFWKYLMGESVARIIEENTPREKEFFAFLLDVFLQDRRGGLKPILTHLDVRLAIVGETWQNRIPLDKRVAVDKSRLNQERKNPRQPFTAKQELAIVTLQVMVDSLDLEDLVPILKAAGEAMEFQKANEELGLENLFSEDDLQKMDGSADSDEKKTELSDEEANASDEGESKKG